MSRRPLPFFRFIAALLTLALGLGLTAALFAGVRSLEQDKVELDFQRRASVRLTAIRHGLDDAVRVLTIVNQLFTTFESVSREQFRTFSQPLLERYPYIQAFNFHRIISAAERPAYEAGVGQIYPNFSVTELKNGLLVPAGVRDSYRVVDYIEPFKGNQKALGFDAASYAFQVEAMARAVDTGLPSATGMLRLVQESGSQRGFIVLMPVYRYGTAIGDVEARRRAVIGDTAAVFRIEDLINKVLIAGGFSNGSGLDINLYAGDAIDEKNLVFRKGDAPIIATQAASSLPKWMFYDQPKAISHNFDVAGQPWHLVFSAQPVLLGSNDSGALLTVIAGMLFSMLAAFYLHSVTARSRRIQQLVDQRTAELKHTNTLLTDDIAARQRAEHALRLRERAIEASANAILVTSASAPDFALEYVNPAFERMTGYTAAEAIGRNCSFLWDIDTDQPGIEEIRSTAREQREGHAVLRNYHKDGTLFWSDVYIAPVKDEDGTVNHFVVALYDITSTKRYEAELEFQANRDVLTGLANRNLLRDRLRQAIAYASRYEAPIWVVFADLDRFKFVNDTLGHKAGDLLLGMVAERFLTAVRDTDTVARLGADEFVLILPERTDEHLSTAVIQRIMDTLAQPLAVEGHEFFLTCSIGVAIYPTDGDDADMLIKHAEIAMYRAKEMGHNNFQFYMPAMNAQALERLRIEGNLRSAIERDEFVLHYQPQVDLRTGRVVGMEALIRWHHPELGMVPPGRFISLAEETGLIVPIGLWVTRTACVQNKAWQDAGLGMLRVAVNLSARQFYQQDLVQSIGAILRDSGLEAQYLEIELTESLVMTDVERAIAILRDLKALGVQISIDDFGTGYSSLSYLKRFPIDVLKIDQSFVRDITLDPDDAAIVLSIISLAHNLRLKVVAEGVETQEQLAYLSDHGCDQMQGYYFSKPVPAHAFATMLKADKQLPTVPMTSPVRRTKLENQASSTAK